MILPSIHGRRGKAKPSVIVTALSFSQPGMVARDIQSLLCIAFPRRTATVPRTSEAELWFYLKRVLFSEDVESCKINKRTRRAFLRRRRYPQHAAPGGTYLPPNLHFAFKPVIGANGLPVLSGSVRAVIGVTWNKKTGTHNFVTGGKVTFR